MLYMNMNMPVSSLQDKKAHEPSDDTRRTRAVWGAGARDLTGDTVECTHPRHDLPHLR